LVEPATGVSWDVMRRLTSRATKDARAVLVFLQFVFSLGLAVVFGGWLLNLPLWLILSLAVVATMVHIYSYERLRDALYELMLRMITERIGSAAGLKALAFNVIYRGHSVLREAIAGDLESTKLYIKISCWGLLTAVSFQAVLVTLIHTASVILGTPLHSLGLGTGVTIIVLSWIAALLVPPYAEVEHGSGGPPRIHVHIPGSSVAKRALEDAIAFGSAVVNRYFFYNIHPILMRVFQAMGVLLRIPPIRIVQQPGIIDPVLLLCSEKMKDIIKERREAGLIEVEGNIEKFFECGNIEGLEEWVLYQEVDTGTALDKLFGGGGGPSSTLVIRVRDRPRGVRVVATAVMKAWCGRKASVNNKQENNRVISFYATGIEEFIWELYLNILLVTRLASEENLCVPGEDRPGPAKDP